MKTMKRMRNMIAAAALIGCTGAAAAQTYSYRFPSGGFSPSQVRLQPITPVAPVSIVNAYGQVVTVRPATTFVRPTIVPWNLAGLPAGARVVPPLPPTGTAAPRIPLPSPGTLTPAPAPVAMASGGMAGAMPMGARASMGPAQGPIGTPILVQVAPNLGATPILIRFEAVLSNGVPGQLLTQLQGSGLNYSTPAPIQLCTQGGGTWDVDLLLSNGQRIDSIGSFRPTNCP